MTVFNNGGVKRMWRWWEKSDPTRLASVPGLIGEPSLHDTIVQQGSLHLDDEGVDHTTTFRKVSSLNYPRTLKDLLSMTEAAREAQWGERGESEAFSSEFPVIGNDFFEDDSDESSDSEEEHVEETLQWSDQENQRKVSYSSNPVTARSKAAQISNDAVDESKDALALSAGAASDMLTPQVKVSNEFNHISLNNQSPDLAAAWKLGDFDTALSSPFVDSLTLSKSIEFSSIMKKYPKSKQGENGFG
jgi:hypothetical protein